MSASSETPVEPGHQGDRGYQSFMMITTIAKKMNIGMTMRSCAALGVSEVWVCGGAFNTFGSHGTQRFVPVREISSFYDALSYAKARGASICAIEITPDAVPVHKHTFTGRTVFVAGNEGEGIKDTHKDALRAAGATFLYVPQYGENGTASMNVSVATSIVLHHFAVQAGFPEAPREPGADKFMMACVPTRSDGVWEDIARQKRDARAAKKASGSFSKDPVGGKEEGGGKPQA